jgi:hypothetical protein
VINSNGKINVKILDRKNFTERERERERELIN